MEQFSTEEQQAEAVRKWLKENGSSIAIGIGLGLLVMFGTNRWQSYQLGTAESASLQYANLQVAAAQGDAGPVLAQSERMRDDYADSAYTSFAALTAASSALKQEAPDVAAVTAQLRWVMEHAPVPGLRDIARVRLARVLLSEGDAAAALALTEGGDSAAFAGLYAEVRGDIALAGGDLQAARKAYATALTALTAMTGEGSALLRVKLENIGGSTGS